MKLNIPLTWIMICYMVINFLFAYHESTMRGGAGLIYVLIFPIFWILSGIYIGFITIRNRNNWFNRNMQFSTICLLKLCTHFPFLLMLYLLGIEIF